jgi:Beta-eliminating lyase
MVVKLRCKETPNDFSGTSLMQTEIIDLRSDTFSLPSKEIRESIAMAEVGDDYYGEDKSAAHLESYCSELFGKEAALFTTSGMLANQLAVALQVTRGNEVVTEYRYHLNLFESAQYAALCHVVLNPRVTEDGVLRAEDVEKAMASKPREAQYAQVQLVAIENPIGSQQGKIFPLEDLRHLRRFTAERKIHLHMWQPEFLCVTTRAKQTHSPCVFPRGLEPHLDRCFWVIAKSFKLHADSECGMGAGFIRLGFALKQPISR